MNILNALKAWADKNSTDGFRIESERAMFYTNYTVYYKDRPLYKTTSCERACEALKVYKEALKESEEDNMKRKPNATANSDGGTWTLTMTSEPPAEEVMPDQGMKSLGQLEHELNENARKLEEKLRRDTAVPVIQVDSLSDGRVTLTGVCEDTASKTNSTGQNRIDVCHTCIYSTTCSDLSGGKKIFCSIGKAFYDCDSYKPLPAPPATVRIPLTQEELHGMKPQPLIDWTDTLLLSQDGKVKKPEILSPSAKVMLDDISKSLTPAEFSGYLLGVAFRWIDSFRKDRRIGQLQIACEYFRLYIENEEKNSNG